MHFDFVFFTFSRAIDTKLLDENHINSTDSTNLSKLKKDYFAERLNIGWSVDCTRPSKLKTLNRCWFIVGPAS